MITLGIETSCDETAIAIINDSNTILAHSLITQYNEHAAFGGVVPEIASRSHLNYIDTLITDALTKANLSIHQIDLFAAGAGPGLIGGLIIGLNMAKSLSLATNKPFVAVNHLEAHALMPLFFEKINFPYLLLLASGGHTQIIKVIDIGSYEILGTTIDDAMGECFDKSAKMLGFNYMGGNQIEQLAKLGDPTKFNLPLPLYHAKNLNFSFSGLKTAVRNLLEKINIDDEVKRDISASLQQTITKIIDKKLRSALKSNPDIKYLVASGGVASNQAIRNTIINIGTDLNIPSSFAPAKYCTDNGVMIAFCGEQNYKKFGPSNYSITPKPRWQLDNLKED